MLPYRFGDDVLAYYPTFRFVTGSASNFDEWGDWLCPPVNIEFTVSDTDEADNGSTVNIEFTDSDDDDDGASAE